VVVDSGYDDNGPFRATLDLLGLQYIAQIKGKTTVLVGDDPGGPPVSVQDRAATLPRRAFQRIRWREGTKGTMTARFAALRVLVPRDEGAAFRADPKLTLLIEWADGASAPGEFWLVNLPEQTAVKHLVVLAHIRWRIERDYEDLKQELGLDHYEGRGQVGCNHHVSVCMAAFAFLLRKRALGFSSCGADFQRLRPNTRTVRPRGSAAAS